MKPIHHILLVVLLYSCSQANTPASTPESRLQTYLSSFRSSSPVSSKAILVIGEGGCITCNKMFSDLVSQSLQNDSLFSIITASGVRTDISPWLQASGPNVHFDHHGEFQKLEIFKGSGIITLKDGVPDTILPMLASGLDQRLDFARQVISPLLSAVE